MPDERRATRQEPIALTVPLADGREHTFRAHPMPWRKRNDVGDTVFTLYRAAVEQLSQTGAQFEALYDYAALFELMFSVYKVEVDEHGAVDFKITPPTSEDREVFAIIGFDEMLEVLGIGLTVNGFERLEWMLDPNRKKVPGTGESEPAEIDEQPKTEPPIDSGSPSPEEADAA